MTYLESEIEDMLDQVWLLADDWSACSDMVAEQPPTPTLHEYLTLLIPRLKNMRRDFNWVEIMLVQGSSNIYKVHNYTYKMYRYLTKKYPEAVTVTPPFIAIPEDVLTEEDRDQFRKQL